METANGQPVVAPDAHGDWGTFLVLFYFHSLRAREVTCKLFEKIHQVSGVSSFSRRMT